jgi:hypothetical protein
MSFLRHDEIYRSDVVWAVRRGSASASPCWGQSIGATVMLDANGENANGERSRSHAPRSSSAMSLGSAIPWRVALQQSPPPLYRPESMLHPPAETVNHHLLGAGEFSTGEMGNFQPALTILSNQPPGPEIGFVPSIPPGPWPPGPWPRERSEPEILSPPVQ